MGGWSSFVVKIPAFFRNIGDEEMLTRRRLALYSSSPRHELKHKYQRNRLPLHPLSEGQSLTCAPLWEREYLWMWQGLNDRGPRAPVINNTFDSATCLSPWPSTASWRHGRQVLGMWFWYQLSDRRRYNRICRAIWTMESSLVEHGCTSYILR